MQKRFTSECVRQVQIWKTVVHFESFGNVCPTQRDLRRGRDARLILRSRPCFFRAARSSTGYEVPVFCGLKRHARRSACTDGAVFGIALGPERSKAAHSFQRSSSSSCATSVASCSKCGSGTGAAVRMATNAVVDSPGRPCAHRFYYLLFMRAECIAV